MALPQIMKLRVVIKTLCVQCGLLAGILILVWGLQHLYGMIDKTTFPQAVSVPVDAGKLEEKEKGKLLVDAITHQMRYELDSVFGWTYNDILFNRVIMDNRAYRQYGVYHATKALIDLYSTTIAKLGANDKESKFLYQARTNGFSIDPRSFMFPSAEGAYKKALGLVDKYKASLDDGTGEYNCRTDDVHAALSLIVGEQLLGYAIGLLENSSQEPFYTLDNHIYEVQGIVLVVRDFLTTLYALYPDIIGGRNSEGNMAAAMRYLTDICVYNPLIITSSFNAGEVILADLTFAKSRLQDIRDSIRM